MESKKLFNLKNVKGTPFAIIKKPVANLDDEERYFVVVGTHIVSQGFETEEEAKDDAKYFEWSKLLAVLDVYVRAYTNDETRKMIDKKMAEEVEVPFAQNKGDDEL